MISMFTNLFKGLSQSYTETMTAWCSLNCNFEISKYYNGAEHITFTIITPNVGLFKGALYLVENA